MREPKKALLMAIIIVLAAVFLATPFIARSAMGNDALIGQASYFHLGVAQNLLQPGSYPLPDVTPTLFDWFLAGLLTVASPAVLSKAVPIALGVAAAWLFMSKAGSLVASEKERALAGLFLIISPLFIITFTSLSPFSLALVLGLAAWRFQDSSRIGSGLLLLSALFVDARAFILTALLMTAYGLLKGSWRGPAVTGAAGLLVMVALDAFWGFLASEQLALGSAMGGFFVSLGADMGYSFFILLLALIGLMARWSRHRSAVAASLLMAGVFFFSFSDPLTRILMAPVLALLAARGGRELLERQWSVRLVRDVTLFLVALSLLFTLVLTLSEQSEEEPSLAQLEALQFLRTVPEGEVVLSSPDNGVFVQRIARRQAFLDRVGGDPSLEAERRRVADRIFSAQRLDPAASLLESHGISHVLVDQEMRHGGVWTAEEQGLLFLMEHSDRFVKVYDRLGVAVYRFVDG
ncbi:hypothetical protein KY327_00375 [Candidatus Woesearchaeota archaeon]|nr:hypothetical protein [Candidatus Woesearchaeota archaeon]